MIEETAIWTIAAEILIGTATTIGVLSRKIAKNEQKIENVENKLENHEHRISKMEDKLYV